MPDGWHPRRLTPELAPAVDWDAWAREYVSRSMVWHASHITELFPVLSITDAVWLAETLMFAAIAWLARD